jgi:hypothetical protein
MSNEYKQERRVVRRCLMCSFEAEAASYVPFRASQGR